MTGVTPRTSSSRPEPPVRPDSPRSWLNRSTGGIAAASLFSDVSHELGTAVLPGLLLSIGAGPAALGLIEGCADGISAGAKLAGGVVTDRLRRRKPLASVGYLVTAVAMAAVGICRTPAQVLACRMAAWIGRGSRSAPRDVLMAEAVPAGSRGRAFGLERAADAAGAVIGPLLALALLAAGTAPRHVLLWSLAPGLAAFLAIALAVVEQPRAAAAAPPGPPGPGVRRDPLADLRGFSPPFRRLLAAVLLFGSGDFSRTLLILYATQHLTEGVAGLSAPALAVALYVLHNAVSAATALPLGALADRAGRRPVLAGGYGLAVLTTLGFAWAPATPVGLAILFAASGLYIACEEVAEKAFAVDLLPAARRGTGLGLLAATNGVGDMVSSAMVGVLWAAFPAAPGVGFVAAAGLQLAGAAALTGVGSVQEPPGRGEQKPEEALPEKEQDPGHTGATDPLA